MATRKDTKKGAAATASAKPEKSRMAGHFRRGWEEPPKKLAGSRKFWLKPGETRELTVLDTMPPVRQYFHPVKIDGDKMEDIRCLGEGRCAFCDAGLFRKDFALLSVIDHTEVEVKDAKLRNMKRVVFAGGNTRELLNTKESKFKDRDGKGLTGMRFSVTRSTGDRAPQCGDDWEGMRRMTIADLKGLRDHEKKPVNIEPFGFSEDQLYSYYDRLFPMMEPEAAREFMANHSVQDSFPRGGASSGGGGGEEKRSERTERVSYK